MRQDYIGKEHRLVTLATEQPEGVKQDKSRMTPIICRNADGSEKTPVWFIGNYEYPSLFQRDWSRWVEMQVLMEQYSLE